MIAKEQEKNKAIILRKAGKTYSEIIAEIGVAKSTLSLWLREVGMSKSQKQRISLRKYEAQKRGGFVRHQARIEKTRDIYARARADIKSINDRELFLIGIVLYWAEGSKITQSESQPLVEFANSDADMAKLFIVWLLKFCDIEKSDIVIRLHLHESHAAREKEIVKQWSNLLDLPVTHFCKTNFKKHNPLTKRTNISVLYKGLVSVRVKKSTDLNRRIQGWIYGIIDTQ